MEDLLLKILIYAGLCSSVILITGILFVLVNKNQYKYITLASSIITVLLIYYFNDSFKGFPENPSVGEYRVKGWEIDETNREIYLLVVHQNSEPKNIAIPFDLQNALLLQEAKKNIGIYKKMALNIKENEDSNNFIFTFIFEKRFKDKEIQVESEVEEVNNTVDVSTYPKPN